jgi:hypothetical protein
MSFDTTDEKNSYYKISLCYSMGINLSGCLTLFGQNKKAPRTVLASIAGYGQSLILTCYVDLNATNSFIIPKIRTVTSEKDKNLHNGKKEKANSLKSTWSQILIMKG